ncbi:MAG: AAA family ATPase [Nitrospirae bacterium]|nr:AAA family ATPase [Nitrospirota bacterium]
MSSSHVPKLIESLGNPSIYPHSVEYIECVETHISWIILTGPYAYKIKKPVNLGFVDFSTLGKRYFYCQEELRLNRRLCPALYLGLVSIRGSEIAPELNGTGPAIEYAVKMVQFDRAFELDKVLKRGESLSPYLKMLATDLAKFHRLAAISSEESFFGTPETIAIPMKDNFSKIREFARDQRELDQIDRLETWTLTSLERHREYFYSRKKRGFIRECHGDLHLANMVLIKDRVMIFDALEFNETLRFIDTISDLAFLLMDLNAMGRPQYANQFLNDYLSETGDYEGLVGLRIYQVYRAMVRAKVASIRMNQTDIRQEESDLLRDSHRNYIDLAEKYIVPEKSVILMTCGLSGSGKSILAKRISDAEGMIWIRSDVERKRMAGRSAGQNSGMTVKGGIYTAEMTQRTYGRINEISDRLLKEGFSVILDGTFLRTDQRRAVIETALKNGTPCIILHCSLSEEELRQRIILRKKEGTDPSEADLKVLAWQKGTFESFSPEEARRVLEINTAIPLNIPGIKSGINRMIEDYYREQERR